VGNSGIEIDMRGMIPAQKIIALFNGSSRFFNSHKMTKLTFTFSIESKQDSPKSKETRPMIGA